MRDYDSVKYNSFNGFFMREIKEGRRPFPSNGHDLAAPCDGKMTAYPIAADSTFSIKGSIYTVDGLLRDEKLAAEFVGGLCLIFRLTPDDYHRYAYIDNGESVCRRKINGVLHTVRPISQGRYDVFAQNSREYEVMQTEHFGKVIQIEVGALFVGRISNHNAGTTFKRGDEKGIFEFGGSTVIMLFTQDSIELDERIFANTLENKETIVKMGLTIGSKLEMKDGQKWA
jgi:phosphatidylserine decarboxylase